MDGSIGISYVSSIGKTYVTPRHSVGVAKIHNPGFWKRVVEALSGIGIDDNQQTAVAKLIGIKQPSVHEWEAGTSMPSISNVQKLATKTNVCVEWLYTSRGPKHPGPPMEAVAERLWSAWGRLTGDEKAELAAYAALKAQGKPEKTPKKRAAV